MKKFEISANMRKEMLADFKASTIQFFQKEKIEFNPGYEKDNLPEIMIEAQLIEEAVAIEIKVKKEWLQKIDGEDNPEKAYKKLKEFTEKWFNENEDKWNEYYTMQEEEEDNDDSDDDDDNDDDKKEESLKEMLKKTNINVIDLTEMPKEKRKEILKEIIKRIKNK